MSKEYSRHTHKNNKWQGRQIAASRKHLKIKHIFLPFLPWQGSRKIVVTLLCYQDKERGEKKMDKPPLLHSLKVNRTKVKKRKTCYGQCRGRERGVEIRRGVNFGCLVHLFCSSAVYFQQVAVRTEGSLQVIQQFSSLRRRPRLEKRKATSKIRPQPVIFLSKLDRLGLLFVSHFLFFK